MGCRERIYPFRFETATDCKRTVRRPVPTVLVWDCVNVQSGTVNKWGCAHETNNGGADRTAYDLLVVYGAALVAAGRAG